ncbi:hypothetical protein G6F37_010170 [Rhizopus arrhizus]|nr:hypothetical protein G6F38_010030 [Rhizopus arrhizus]KAG1153644.1 hypothetical protein G6F37_010170 [Rhizopus arrhizus]
MIVHSLADVDVPANNYAVAKTDWADAKGVYTLYASQNTSNDKFIPVHIAIQEEVDQTTMLKTIEQCAFVYEKHRILPTVLVISIKSSSRLKNDGGFSAVDNSFLMQYKSKFWANECFLFFPDDLFNVNIVNRPTPALFTLSQFISNPNKSFTLSHNLNTQTTFLACEATSNKK